MAQAKGESSLCENLQDLAKGKTRKAEGRPTQAQTVEEKAVKKGGKKRGSPIINVGRK